MPRLSLSLTSVFDSYWRFAVEPQAMYEKRLSGEDGPWTRDPILRTYRFTNVYRATDRVSQYLIAEVQQAPGRSQAPAELFFRTLLFKIFNRIETWRTLEMALGPLSWQSADLNAIKEVLDAQWRVATGYTPPPTSCRRQSSAMSASTPITSPSSTR